MKEVNWAKIIRLYLTVLDPETEGSFPASGRWVTGGALGI